MWIFMNDSMLSVVENYDDPNTLMVRSRAKGDIEAVFPDADVITNAGTDYSFRAFIPRSHVATVIANRINNIDYGNFKDSIPKHDAHRHEAYFNVWAEMYTFQLEKEGRNFDWEKYYNSKDFELPEGSQDWKPSKRGKKV